jgi:VanZ family protein
MPKIARLFITLCVAAALYLAAINNDVYLIASPPNLAWHTFLRKAESLVAFALVGLLAGWTIGPRRNFALLLAVALAAYSALIEVGQRLTGTHEPLRLSLFDVTCGAVGGVVAAWIMLRLSSKLSRR